MEKFSDSTLVYDVQSGDRAAYEILINRYYRRIYAVCLGIVSNPHDSQDLCQEAMLRGYLKIHNLRDTKQFSCWLTEIAKTTCYGWIRKQKLNRKKMVQFADRPDHSQKDNTKEDLNEVIAQLPMELRIPLLMYYMDGKNVQGIAEQLNTSASSVWRRLRKAKSCLHELLSEVQNETV